VKVCRRLISNQVQEIKYRYTEYTRKQTDTQTVLDTVTFRMSLVAITEQIINYRLGGKDISVDQGNDEAKV
jgi:hypothetical protein